MINKDGKFAFDVPEGAYSLEVRSPQYIYPAIRVTVSEKGSTAYLVTYGSDWSNSENRLPMPLILSPRAESSYFVPREGFKISHLFANPMMLMMGFSVLMLFVMPKLMANMDPQAMEEMQEFQSQAPNFEMPDISATLAKFSAGSSNAPKKRS
ncbi:ER membrane protein complex subunit 7 [Actinomortierella wolfii]|nr:ER membrane protein complex subunit 7 [Actinomortierella wolfii]